MKFTVSVCMASYNGEKFIKEQIISIISQFINKDDELIIVDDCSTDDTVKIIKKINSKNIKLFFNNKNIGVVKTFERAIQKAKNPLIFLSDQDDIWLPHKISVYKTIFLQEKNIDLIQSDHYLIDKNSKIIKKYFLRDEHPFKIYIPLVNVRCHGPGIAISQKAKKFVLPFPNKISSHDQWIGIILSIRFKIKHINIPCQKYRIHDNQVCSAGRKSRRTFLIILKSRAYMLFSICRRIIKYYCSISD